MLSLTQMLSPSSSTASSRLSSPMTVNPFPGAASSTAGTSATGSTIPGGPPHYNILVLGSDSAPLASTLYKMSSLLPSATKIRHYQEISGFFVAHFRSNGSFSCSPTMTPTMSTAPTKLEHSNASVSSSVGTINPAATTSSAAASALLEREGIDEVKSRRGSIQDAEGDDSEETKTLSQQDGEEEDPIMKLISARSSEETLLQLKVSSGADGIYGSGDSTTHSVTGMDCEEVLLSENESDRASIAATATETDPTEGDETDTEPLNASANASLSVHAFSLDTTWPVPRILAQTFWFPFAHGIVYIVDATRKNDPRGIDHLLNARQFLASLIADTHFRRKDIPVVVFANKAGLDPETCYRVDEIAEILGCEDWDLTGSGSDGEGGGGGGGDRGRKVAKNSRPGKGKGDTQSIGGRKSGEGEVVDADALGAFKTRPWCVKSTRCDGAGDGLRESVEWLKSRMGETWKP
ncbi:hypothetical protein EC991_004438 [Linnemannia zychae]|nr:hypothetical protein EC991_004438 [Linnemannia zychae]